jgi:D-3-phosphoglycerate dehydrogenase
MYKIAIIENIHQDGIDLLKNHKDFDYEIIKDVSQQNLIKRLPEFDGCTLRVSKLDSKILSHCKKMKVISRHGVGFDNVDLDFIKENKISLLITNTANAVAVAEHVMYMMLTLSKGITQYDKKVRTGNFKNNITDIKTFELLNKEILIAGFGRTGKKLIKRCLGFDMTVKVFDPFLKKEDVDKFGGTKVDNFNEAVKTADYISIHMPLSDKTKNLINYNILKTMKKNSIIINTARGGIINELDLDKALNDNLIFGAGLDVFEKEPINLDNPLIKNNKVLLSPHTATFTKECTSRMSIETTKNIIDFFEKTIDKSMFVKL